MKSLVPGNKYKAFTIIEVMIVMLLSSFLILISMQMYLMFGRLIQLKNNQMECAKEAMQFYQTLKSDMDKAIFIESKNKEVLMAEPDKRLIRYEFEDSYAIRTTGFLTDTFKMDISEVVIKKEPITGYVCSVELETKKCNEDYPVYLTKTYTNEMIMNRSALVKKNPN